MAEEAKRTRMNLSQGAKGTFTMDVTTEYPTPQEAGDRLGEAVDIIRKVAADKGLVLVQAAVEVK